jgi:hypothetical protein
MLFVILAVFVLVCFGGTRKWTKKTAQNTAEMVRWTKLPEHLKAIEEVNNLPRHQRREIMRQAMIEAHGQVAAQWNHATVRAAFNGPAKVSLTRDGRAWQVRTSA